MYKIHYIDEKLKNERVQLDIKKHSIVIAKWHADCIVRYYENDHATKLNSSGESFATPLERAATLQRIIKEDTERQNNYYSQVKIVEVEPNKYFLVYDEIDTDKKLEGTGPFKTLEAATSWFLNGGR